MIPDHRMLGVSCWMSVGGCWMLGVCCLVLDVGCWPLVVCSVVFGDG